MTDSSAPSRLRAVVVGLGQIGSRFDEDPGRKAIWTHVGAYLHHTDRIALCGVAETAQTNIEAFRQRCPTVPVHAEIAELIAQHRPQIASICTPAGSHGAVLRQLLECPDLKFVWCEKPLSDDLEEARWMVEACAERGIQMMVSFNRSWLPLWRRTRALMEEGAAGTVRSIRVALPNRLFSIGSHATHLALFLGGPVAEVAPLSIPALEETGEPAVIAAFRYASGAGGHLQVTGFKSQLLCEAEIIGDDGRIWVREDKGRITIERFETSANFAGYRQLGEETVETLPSAADFSAFVAMAQDALNSLDTGKPVSCDGALAFEVQRVLAILATAP